MKLSDIWPTNEVVSWLQQILSERFGHIFILDRTAPQTIRLTLSDAIPVIDISTNTHYFSRTGSDLPCCHWNAAAEGWNPPLDKPLPAPGADILPSPLIEQAEAGYRIHYDILGLTYWMLSRQEEIGRTKLDNHNRFPAASSHAYKHDYLERPIVDEWLNVLGQVVQRACPGIELRRHRFNMKVSHDVDSLYSFASIKELVLGMGDDVLKRGNIRSALLKPWVRMNTRNRLHSADPANTFEWIMDISDKYGLTSAFYFMCGKTAPGKDGSYEPEHPAIRHLMRRIHERGHEIGLHPSYNTYRNPAAIVTEAQRLRKVCAEEGIEQIEWGGRMHYLRWEQPTTLQGWEQAGMSYDSTLSYADHAGFRCGTCFEYPAFDPVADKALNLRIRSLIAMDCTVMAKRYMGLGSGETAFEKFSELKKSCKTVNGCFTLLWHNTELETLKKRKLYQSILA